MSQSLLEPPALPATPSAPHATRPFDQDRRLTAPTLDRPPLPTVRLAGVELHALTEEQVVETILAELEVGRGGVVVTPNLDHLHRCGKDVTFAALVAEADLVVADGMPLIWASRLRGTPLPERVAGSNLISTLSAAAAQAGRRVFLLGGDPGAAEGAARVLRERFADLQVVGTHCPPRGFEDDDAQMAIIVDGLVAAQAEIVFVALGSPKQERLIAVVRRSLPTAWWLGVGISFSFLTGQVRRAPPWMQKSGLEWVHRLFQEPKRLLKRYLVTGIPYAGRLAARSLGERLLAAVGYTQPEAPKRPSMGLRLPENVVPDRVETPQDSTLDPSASSSSSDVEETLDELPEATATSEAEPRTEALEALSRLKALILLGGKVRPTPFSVGCGRPALELPVADGERLMDFWLRQAEGVARLAGIERLPVRVIVSDALDEPSARQSNAGDLEQRPFGAYTVERDVSAFRGTGGVLHDLAADYADDDLLLVCNAGQLLVDALPVVARALAHKGADVAVIAHEDGTPSGVTLLRVATLRGINPVGFVDFKEQALPKIAKTFAVRAVKCRRPTAVSVRSTDAYIAALQQHHAKLAGRSRGVVRGPLEENFAKHFAVVEPGADVDASAYLHDAVVLRGARVESGATVVRSVVCEGTVVPRGARIVDSLVTRADAAA